MTAPIRTNSAVGRPHFGGVKLDDEVEDFERQVIQRSIECPVLVEFWTPWCEANRTLEAALQHVARRRIGSLGYVRVNAEMRPEVVDRFNVEGVPTVKLFVGGTPIADFTGSVSEEVVDQWLNTMLSAAGRLPGATPLPAGD